MKVYAKHQRTLDYIHALRSGREVKVPMSVPFAHYAPEPVQELLAELLPSCVEAMDRPEAVAQHIMDRLMEDADIVPMKQGFLWLKPQAGVLLVHTGLSLFYGVSDTRTDAMGENHRAFSVVALLQGTAEYGGGVVALEAGVYYEETGRIQLADRSYSVYDADPAYLSGSFYAVLLRYLFFRDYVELEEATIHQKDQRTRLGGEKYLNPSPVKVRIIDSRWFRSVTVVGGAKVRGHLRLQAHGPRHSLRKVIWVKGHEREGYTRRAGKEAVG